MTRYGIDSAELVYEEPSGRVDRQLIFRGDAAGLELVPEGPDWSFQADGQGFRLVSEAYRIHLAHLFDPVLAVHASRVDPLPHQITAVYETMLTRQPLRYLLADDPGAGKTIMTGLLIIHQALSSGRTTGRGDAPSAPANGHTTQWEGGGFPALPPSH